MWNRTWAQGCARHWPRWGIGLLVSTVIACSQSAGDAPERQTQELERKEDGVRQPKGGETLPIGKLPFEDPLKLTDAFIQRLREPTKAGENVALHTRLPPPSNERLRGSLVRVLGDRKAPLVLFRADALVELGFIEQSPGRDFFTTLLQLDEAEVDHRLRSEKRVAKLNEPTRETLVFQGRTPVAVSTGIPFDAEQFARGRMIPLGSCPVVPLSTQDRWDESLLIRHPNVVRDSERTHDACEDAGNPDGVWTFKHLMTEMATGSGMSTHDFVVSWLERWLNPYTVNGDVVPARPAMFDQVIRPWADASGISASLQSVGRVRVLRLRGELDLDLAPFRLAAIVNRIDLGESVDGPSGYGGTTTANPVDAGELRFVFGVQNLDSCRVLPFSVILEYGVPIEGCASVRKWANEWIQLNDVGFAAPFSDAWRDHLESLTQAVVVHGAAPDKGNQNAINQIRTNENALNRLWELREFTLTEEDPNDDTDTPISGALQPHTVAMTPDDTAYSPTPHPVVDAFVQSDVKSGVPAVVPSLPQDCAASYSVPGHFAGRPFRGGNSFMAPPTHWEANVNPGDHRELCSRHQFSLNTCNGCHSGDTLTPFFHVDPRVIPAGLSRFLTGNGGVFLVNDTQFGAPQWRFSDLRHRFKRLYEIACAQCSSRPSVEPGFIELIAKLNEVVPIDPIDPRVDLPFTAGPVSELEVVHRLLEARSGFLDPELTESAELGNFARPVQSHAH